MRRPDEMRGNNTSTIGMALRKLLHEYNISGKYDETKLISSWGRLMGKPIASRTKKIFIRDKKLVVELSSAPLKHELTIAKRKVLQILSEEFGDNVVEDVIFL